jgi:hypothetical protein
MEKEMVDYEQRIVAFIDILGFKKIIRDSETDVKKLKIIHETLEFLKSQEKPDAWSLQLVEIEESAQYKGVKNFDIADKISCTCFSDSIVISVQTDNNKINEVTSTLIANIAYIGTKLMTEGILLRGAITIGKLIHTDNGVIMGQALIDAYEIEKSVASQARIVISDKLLCELNYPLKAKRNRYPYHQYLTRFEDGCVGFHQMIYFQVLQSWTEMDDTKMKTGLKKIRKTIIDGLDSTFQQPDIFSKYVWLKDQYNELIILTDGLKSKIHKLSDNGHNIHCKFTDEINNKD